MCSTSENNLTSATQNATHALETFDKELVPTHPRIAPTLIALASIHILSGHPDQTAPLDARLATILQKPLGPWKEDYLDTLRFYAALLKKSNQPAAAAHLDQLYARQKDKR